MSNAAVIKLQRKTIAGNSVWMDDNFGESVHLHINDFRADLSCREFEQMARDSAEVIDEIVGVEGFHAADYDPVFMEQMLWKHLLALRCVKKDTVKLSELWINEPRLVRIKDSRMYRNMKSAGKKVRSKGSDHFGQSGRERVELIRKSMQENGYDESKGCFVVYGNDNIIRDGQHRACALYLQQGDMEVPVIRLYFSDYRKVNTKLRSSAFGFFYHCVYRFNEIRRTTNLFSKNTLKALLKGGYFVTKNRPRRGLRSMTKKQAEKLAGIFGK